MLATRIVQKEGTFYFIAYKAADLFIESVSPAVTILKANRSKRTSPAKTKSPGSLLASKKAKNRSSVSLTGEKSARSSTSMRPQ